MQSIRLFQRHNFNSSITAHLKSTRGYLASCSSSSSTTSNGLSFLESNSTARNGVVDSKFMGNSIDSSKNYVIWSLPKFASRFTLAFQTNLGSPAVTLTSFNNNGRSPRPSLFQWAAVAPPFSSRSLTTVGNSVESELQGSSAPISDLAPRIKFKRLDKTARNIMQILNKEAVEEVRTQREIPDIKPGYIVQLKVEVPENKRRVSIIKGIVIARRNAGLNTTFRLRRLVAGVGVESLFPLYSPNIKEIKVLDKKKVRRAKLYYLRDKMNALRK